MAANGSKVLLYLVKLVQRLRSRQTLQYLS